MEFRGAQKRGGPHGPINGNDGYKKSKQELESFPTGIGSKSKPCTKFFSTSGCPFGEGCHFLHYVPGGLKAVTQMLGSNPALPAATRNSTAAPFPDGSSALPVKTRLCNRFNSPEGCKFGDKCHFAHGEWELGRPAAPVREESHGMFQTHGGFANPTSFGSSAAAKISIDASLTGTIIGKGGVNSKHICRVTGAKLAVRDHEVDPNLKNIELEGTFDQIEQASRMVRELIASVRTSAATTPMKKSGFAAAGSFKTKICENFAKGSCTFGEKCHFAHGSEELRAPGP